MQQSLLLFHKDAQQIGVPEGGGGVGAVQQGVDVVCVVLDLLGVELEQGNAVPVHVGGQDAAGHQHLDAPDQIVVGHRLIEIAVDAVLLYSIGF